MQDYYFSPKEQQKLGEKCKDPILFYHKSYLLFVNRYNGCERGRLHYPLVVG